MSSNTTHPPTYTANSNTINGQTYNAFSDGAYSTYLAWKAFDSNVTTYWMSGDNVYNSTTGITTSTTVLAGDGYAGCYVGFTLPYRIVPVTYTLTSGNMKSWRLYGKQNDSSSWEVLDEQVDQTSPDGVTYTLSESAQARRYTQFAVQVYKVVSPTFGRVNCKTFFVTGAIITQPDNPWPPTAGYTATSNAFTVSGQSYGNGNYIASASSIYVWDVPAYKAFDNDAYTWWASLAKYNSNGTHDYTGTTTTTDKNSTVYSGEWLQVQLPQSIYATSYVITPQWAFTYPGTSSVNQPATWYLFGSSTGADSSWTLLHSGSCSSWTQSAQTFTIVSNNTAYSYYRIVSTNIVSNTSLGIATLKIMSS